MIVGGFSQSMSPGNELRNMFHSEAADRQGSQNYMGIKNPVVDALVENVINATDRQQLIIACHALDRVLLHGDYLVPNWYINKHRVAYWDKFSMPETLPLYYNPEAWALESWWLKQ
jgi:microcin C transport system substrate-binding protein